MMRITLVKTILSLWPPFGRRGQAIDGPLHAEAAESYVIGATAGEGYVVGSVASESHVIGAVAGEGKPQ